MKKLTRFQKFKAFIFSYSGGIAAIGVLLLVCLILCSYWELDKSEYKKWVDLLSPIAMSVVASAIFYFISFYFPNLKKNRQESAEVEDDFQRLRKLNQYSLIALGLGTCHDPKTEKFIRPNTEQLISVSDGHDIFEEPYKEVWQEDEIYPKFSSCKNWIDYFKVLTSEQLDILETINRKARLHPIVKEEILGLKSSFGLISYLNLIISIENYRQEKDLKRPYKPLFHLILGFLTHVERIERIEARFHDSIYSPI